MAKRKKYENPEADRLVALWNKARSGNGDAGQKLLHTLTAYPSPDAFAKAWALMTVTSVTEHHLTKEELQRLQERRERWQKSAAGSSPSLQAARLPSQPKNGYTAVSGGLPSLGKRSR